MVGTSGAARIVTEAEPPNDIPSSLWRYRLDRRRVIVGGALSDGGGLFEHLREMWCPETDAEELSDQLSRLKPDSHGLTVLPFWAGERSTNWSPNAFGAILGLTNKTTAAEVLRAAMEAVAFRFALIVKSLQSVSPVGTIVASGNALQESHVWTQIIADVLGQPVMLSSAREASTRGAALLALAAAGKIQLNKQSISECEKVFEPDLSNHAKYQAGIERQEKVYNQVSWMFG
jgi:gluconokinase